ncbi:MAG: hypothetical protein LBN32_03910 [Helicobacteraceae bacterium]|jgi:hypothetical protein|nr:hypothetical protein [Helicobacteraceae bacterium]
MTIGSVANPYQHTLNRISQSSKLNPTEFFQSLPQKAQEAMMKSISHLSEEEQQEKIRMLRNNYPFLSTVKPTQTATIRRQKTKAAIINYRFMRESKT